MTADVNNIDHLANVQGSAGFLGFDIDIDSPLAVHGGLQHHK